MNLDPESYILSNRPLEKHVVPASIVEKFWERYLDRVFTATYFSRIVGVEYVSRYGEQGELVTEVSIDEDEDEDDNLQRSITFRQEFSTPI